MFTAAMVGWGCGTEPATERDAEAFDASSPGDTGSADTGTEDARMEDAGSTFDVGVVPDAGPAGDVVARIKVLTRVDGVSPETVYFSAQDSTCSDCEDIWELDTPVADAYSELAYYFDFGDPDSGIFATTGNSRNEQVSSSPRAAHTFTCTGERDPNWDPEDLRCEFNVGVRVQAKDGDHHDAFIRINIQAQTGPGGFYPDANVYCVSSTSDFRECPHDDASRHLTDTPEVGAWNRNLVLFHNDGGTYSSIFMGVDEQHATAATYGSGPRAIIPAVFLAARPGAEETAWRNDSNIRMLADHHPERDADGNLIDGYAFAQKVTGLRVGRVRNGQSHTMIMLHDLDMDWESTGDYIGSVSIASTTNFCESADEIDCLPDDDSPGIPYPSYFSLTDTKLTSASSNLGFGVTCVNACGLVNSVVQGVEVNRTTQHNFRLQGAWGLILSNNWMRGNHVGGSGPKQRITVRPVNSGGGATSSPDLTKDPEDLSGTDFFHGVGNANHFHNRYNVAIDNRLNQETHDAEHQSSNLLEIVSYFGTTYGTTYVPQISEPRPGQGMFLVGRFQTIRNTTWGSSGQWFVDVGAQETYFDGLPYHDTTSVCIEGTFTQSRGAFCGDTAPLSIPDAPGTR